MSMLVVLESGWMEGIQFLTFGIQEAFAIRLAQNCSVLHHGRAWTYANFNAGIDHFIDRAMAFASNNPIPEQHVHVATGVAETTHNRKKAVLFFGIIAVFYKKRMIGLRFEPHWDIPPEFDEWAEEKDTYVGTLDPSRCLSAKNQRRALLLTDTITHGLEIGIELYEWSRHGSSNIEVRLRN